MRPFLGMGFVLVLLLRIAGATPNPDHLQSLEFVKRQLERLCALTGNGYPDYTEKGRWKIKGPDEWTAGYFPGMLWKVYEQTRETVWLERARRWTEPIAAFRHDERDLNFGLLFKPTFAEGYRLTGDKHYRKMALEAAANQAKRHMPEGKYLRSWGQLDDPNEQGFIIIDSLIDMSLLLWAAQEDCNPFLFEVAHDNSLVILQTTVREDGSSVQVVELDPQTGRKLRDHCKQAYSVNSCWSRGQGWGIYAFSEIYEYTKDYRFLKAAQAMADYYLAHVPADFIPYWDFLAPNIPNEVRDSSAAALAASGLLELAHLVTDPSRQRTYHQAAVKTVDSLTRNCLGSGEARDNGRILMHGTLHKPAGIGVDESLIFGDYYFLEALLKLVRESIQ